MIKIDKELIKHFDEYEIRLRKKIIEELLKKFTIDHTTKEATIKITELVDYAEPKLNMFQKIIRHKDMVFFGMLIAFLISSIISYVVCTLKIPICGNW